jgi:Outer membrane protein beta-barrel domain
MPGKKIRGLLLLINVFIAGKSFCQDDPTYLFHPNPVTPPGVFQEQRRRAFKTSIDAGLVFGFTGVSGVYTNYVSGMSAKVGYTFGLIEEIPVQRRSYIEIGAEIFQDGLSFNSYFFAPGASVVYDGNEIYNHNITMNEVQIPVLYKVPLGPTDRKLRCVYMTVGAKFRYVSYTNSTVDSSGYLIWAGQKDVSSYYKLFSPFGSSVFEISLGYQRNTIRKIRRGWYMNLEYDYGLSPLVYSGNREGSNYVVFHLNTLTFKIGKIF